MYGLKLRHGEQRRKVRKQHSKFETQWKVKISKNGIDEREMEIAAEILAMNFLKIIQHTQSKHILVKLLKYLQIRRNS